MASLDKIKSIDQNNDGLIDEKEARDMYETIKGFSDEQISELGLGLNNNELLKNGVGINVELFPELPGRGLIQLDHMTSLNELIPVKVDGEISRTLPDRRLAQSYFANMIREIVVDSVYNPAKKLKAPIRVNNILQYLNQANISNPNEIIDGMRDALTQYKESGYNKETGTYEYSDYLLKAIEEVDVAELYIQRGVDNYNRWTKRIERKGEKLDTLPNFNEFMLETNLMKSGLKDVEHKLDTVTTIEELNRYEIILKDYANSLKEYKQLDMRNPKNVAYFIQLDIIEYNYIKEIRDKIDEIKSLINNN